MVDVIELPVVRGWEQVSFDPVQPRSTSRMEGRRTEAQAFGTPYWTAAYTPGWLSERDYGLMDAFMMRAGDGQEVFRAHDPFRPRPIEYAQGFPYAAIGTLSSYGNVPANRYRRDQYDVERARSVRSLRAMARTYVDGRGVQQTAQPFEPVPRFDASGRRVGFRLDEVLEIFNAGVNDWTLETDGDEAALSLLDGEPRGLALDFINDSAVIKGPDVRTGISGNVQTRLRSEGWLVGWTATRRSEVPAWNGQATITARTATSLTVSGVIANMQFRAGDYVEVRKSASVMSLHRIMADVQANGSGVVTLSIRYPLDLQTFTLPLTANFEKASCLMQIDPGSYQGQKSWGSRSPSFSATEVFFS